MKKIVLGLPKGSLNNVNRGNTHKLLVDAGYEVKDTNQEMKPTKSM